MSETLNRKLYVAVILSTLLIFFFARLNFGYAAETPADTGKVLVFLRDVVQLDMTKYETTLISNGTIHLPSFGGFTQTDGQYRVSASGLNIPTILTVTFTFLDEQLISLSIHEDSQGPALYAEQPPTDLKEAASGLLQRYQTLTGDAQLSQMRSILDTVDVASNSTKTVDSLELEVNVKDNKTVLTWSNTLNGASYSSLKLSFEDGLFNDFWDNRGTYKLGSSEVNISQEEAVSIALKRAESYSYQFDGKEITNLGIVKEQIHSSPVFLHRTDWRVVYPCWMIDLPLDKPYPGFVSYIEVMIWADSGEVISCEALGYDFPTGPSDQTPPSESTQTENDDTQLKKDGTPPTTMYIAATAAAITILTVASVIIIKKRKSKKLLFFRSGDAE